MLLIMDGKHILLGVSGGIAAYKAPQLVRDLRSAGADVSVVMTRSASKFVTATSLQAVSERRVREDLWDADAEGAMSHIELARWADIVVIAPATAHIIARLAGGVADDLLTTLCLATKAPIMVAPAMNQQMWLHPATQRNVELIKSQGANILGPDDGDQACGEIGPGRMIEPIKIVATVEQQLAPKQQTMEGLNVLVTAGPTHEPIDPVRFISNSSSGKQGFALARAAQEAGANVTLVSGPVALKTPNDVRRLNVLTASEMKSAVEAELETTDIFIGVAAVSDYRPSDPQDKKIKKHETRSSELFVGLTENPDILEAAAANNPRPYIVGFAAETNDTLIHAREKLERKGCDAIIANDVSNPNIGFDSDDNAVTLIHASGETFFPFESKKKIAVKLVIAILELYKSRQHSKTPSLERIT